MITITNKEVRIPVRRFAYLMKNSKFKKIFNELMDENELEKIEDLIDAFDLEEAKKKSTSSMPFNEYLKKRGLKVSTE